MKLCRVVATVTMTEKDPAYHGRKLLAVQALDENERPQGTPYVAVDVVQAGVGDRVLVLTEGTGVRQILRDARPPPIRSLIVGIVDHVDVDVAGRS